MRDRGIKIYKIAAALLVTIVTSIGCGNPSDNIEDEDGGGNGPEQYEYMTIEIQLKEDYQNVCMEQGLEWNGDISIAVGCEVYLESDNGEECPFDSSGIVPSLEELEDINGTTIEIAVCALPKIESPKECEQSELEFVYDGFGWYYCEDNRENYEEACDPEGVWSGEDEDEDGEVDCEDDSCWDCGICEGYPEVDPEQATSDCIDSCKNAVRLSGSVTEQFDGEYAYLRCEK